MSDPFSVLAHAQNQFHLDVLEADFVKVHSSELMSTENNCQGAIPSVGNADSPVFSHFLLVLGVGWLRCNSTMCFLACAFWLPAKIMIGSCICFCERIYRPFAMTLLTYMLVWVDTLLFLCIHLKIRGQKNVTERMT